MNILDSLKTIWTLSTRIQILYRQFTLLKKAALLPLDKINISDTEQVVTLRQSLVATSLELMFLISESTLDEYNSVLTPATFPEYRNQILAFKKDIKPATKLFNKWTNRRQYRNILVAHNLRLPDNNSIFATKEKIKINAPHYDNDYVVIYYLHIFMCHCLGKHFSNELAKINKSEKIIDFIEFISEWKSLKEELPIIEGWVKERGLEILDLNEHIKELNRSK